jgi:Amt family ammonium transporter
MLLGKRKGLGRESFDPHDTTMVVLGAGLLWFGWFGFNAGSDLAALTWMTVSWIVHRRPSVLGAAAGAVASAMTFVSLKAIDAPSPGAEPSRAQCA